MDWEAAIKKILEAMGFRDFRAEVDSERRRGSVYIYDNPALLKENLSALVEGMNHFLQLLAKKAGAPPIFLDINNYRQERERLIAELARAAARKAAATREDVPLPAMNAYERRIVHTELASHPQVTTESSGIGKERFVVIRAIGDNQK